MDRLDENKDGRISFEEWRDFLLVCFSPSLSSTIHNLILFLGKQLLPKKPSIQEIYHYYQSQIRNPISMLTPDADVTLGTREGTTPPTAPDEEAEDKHEHHGMFKGAGKFLLAGGIAGAVSRTATAPFDRLKVYLITDTNGGAEISKKVPSVAGVAESAKKVVQTGAVKEVGQLGKEVGKVGKEAGKAGKEGSMALRRAITDIYGTGGVRGFFVGNG